MAEPFSEPSSGRGLMARLGGRPGRPAAARELRALLADAPRVRDLSLHDVDGIAERNGIDLSRSLGAVRRDLYRRFLEHCLLDCALSSEERADLVHLRGLLRLESADAAEVHDRVAHEVYGAALGQGLEDHRLDPEEEDFLRRLREDLRLPERVAEELRERAESRARRRFVAAAAVHENLYVAAREATIELEGSSPSSLEDAVRDAVERACRALPGLDRAEVVDFRARLEEGRVVGWEVRVRAVVPEDP